MPLDDRLDGLCVSAPLLSFLSDSIIHYDHTVKSQSMNHGFGDSASRGNLRNAWLMSDGVDDVG